MRRNHFFPVLATLFVATSAFGSPAHAGPRGSDAYLVGASVDDPVQIRYAEGIPLSFNLTVTFVVFHNKGITGKIKGDHPHEYTFDTELETLESSATVSDPISSHDLHLTDCVDDEIDELGVPATHQEDGASQSEACHWFLQTVTLPVTLGNLDDGITQVGGKIRVYRDGWNYETLTITPRPIAVFTVTTEPLPRGYGMWTGVEYVAETVSTNPWNILGFTGVLLRNIDSTVDEVVFAVEAQMPLSIDRKLHYQVLEPDFEGLLPYVFPVYSSSDLDVGQKARVILSATPVIGGELSDRDAITFDVTFWNHPEDGLIIIETARVDVYDRAKAFLESGRYNPSDMAFQSDDAPENPEIVPAQLGEVTEISSIDEITMESYQEVHISPDFDKNVLGFDVGEGGVEDGETGPDPTYTVVGNVLRRRMSDNRWTPVAGAYVALYDEDVFSDDKICGTFTGPSGGFRLQCDSTADAFSKPDPYVLVVAANRWNHVAFERAPLRPAVYTMKGQTYKNSDNRWWSEDFYAGSGNIKRAFHVLHWGSLAYNDAVIRVGSLRADSAPDKFPISLRYPSGHRASSSWYAWYISEIQLKASARWNLAASLIMHEMGHAILHTLQGQFNYDPLNLSSLVTGHHADSCRDETTRTNAWNEAFAQLIAEQNLSNLHEVSSGHSCTMKHGGENQIFGAWRDNCRKTEQLFNPTNNIGLCTRFKGADRADDPDELRTNPDTDTRNNEFTILGATFDLIDYYQDNHAGYTDRWNPGNLRWGVWSNSSAYSDLLRALHRDPNADSFFDWLDDFEHYQKIDGCEHNNFVVPTLKLNALGVPTRECSSSGGGGSGGSDDSGGSGDCSTSGTGAGARSNVLALLIAMAGMIGLRRRVSRKL